MSSATYLTVDTTSGNVQTKIGKPDVTGARVVYVLTGEGWLRVGHLMPVTDPILKIRAYANEGNVGMRTLRDGARWLAGIWGTGELTSLETVENNAPMIQVGMRVKRNWTPTPMYGDVTRITPNGGINTVIEWSDGTRTIVNPVDVTPITVDMDATHDAARDMHAVLIAGRDGIKVGTRVTDGHEVADVLHIVLTPSGKVHMLVTWSNGRSSVQTLSEVGPNPFNDVMHAWNVALDSPEFYADQMGFRIGASVLMCMESAGIYHGGHVYTWRTGVVTNAGHKSLLIGSDMDDATPALYAPDHEHARGDHGTVMTLMLTTDATMRYFEEVCGGLEYAQSERIGSLIDAALRAEWNGVALVMGNDGPIAGVTEDDDPSRYRNRHTCTFAMDVAQCEAAIEETHGIIVGGNVAYDASNPVLVAKAEMYPGFYGADFETRMDEIQRSIARQMLIDDYKISEEDIDDAFRAIHDAGGSDCSSCGMGDVHAALKVAGIQQCADCKTWLRTSETDPLCNDCAETYGSHGDRCGCYEDFMTGMRHGNHVATRADFERIDAKECPYVSETDS